jgi:glutamate-1-semialdehyde 2,1-aminomutase
VLAVLPSQLEHRTYQVWQMPVPVTRAIGMRTRSEQLLERAKKSVAGGDSSTMRVLPYHPALLIDRGQGCHIWDVDGNDYIDLNMAYGPLLFGHRPPFLIEKVVRQLQDKGSQFGFPQELNFQVAEKVKQLFPSIELLRFANSGTEAVASSIRVARAFTGRPNVILFEGHYHGWSDAVFHRYHASEGLGDEAVRAVIPGTEGMNGAPHDAYLLRWNDAAALSSALDRMRGSVAAVLMEPVMGNAGVIPPLPGYLQAVRELTQAHGALLIFDEVITGMRVAAGGAQELFAVEPDLTVLSKVLGGGFPVAAFGGSAAIMELVASGKVFHGGVYAGNAMVLSAADAVLAKVLAERSALYSELNARAQQLADGIREILGRRNVQHVVQHVGPMIAMVLTKTPTEHLVDYREVLRHADFERYIELQHALLDNGVYIHPNQYEPMFLSVTHCKEDIDEVLSRLDETVEHWQR